MKQRPSPAGPFSDTGAELPESVSKLPKSDILLGYQQKAIKLLTTTALLVIEKSRRIGLTWGLASYAALIAGASRAAGGMKVWYMGYDQEMAREFIDVVGMWAKAFGIAAGAMHETILEDEEGDIKAFRITFASGFEVVALPSVARALRGKQGLVIIDEAAFHKNLAEVLKSAIALLMWGGRVVVVSTHDGVDNAFNQLLDQVNSGERRGATLKITFDDAIADGLYERVALVMRGKGQTPPPREEWIALIRETYGDDQAEELDCVPAAGAGSWINSEDIAACEHPDAGKEGKYAGGLTYVGYDVARRRDLAVIWAFELVGKVLWLRSRWERPKTRFSVQTEELVRITGTSTKLGAYRVAAMRIDQTGMGEKVVEDAQGLFGATRCQGVLFTGPNRLDLATQLRDRFEAGTIRIPPDPAIRTDFRALKRAGRDGKALIEQGDVHPDMFWAAGLACDGARNGIVQYGYTAAARVTALDYGRAGEAADDERLVLGAGGYEKRSVSDQVAQRGTW